MRFTVVSIALTLLITAFASPTWSQPPESDGETVAEPTVAEPIVAEPTVAGPADPPTPGTAAPPPTGEAAAAPQEIPAEIKEELDRRIEVYERIRQEFADAVIEQRVIHIRYCNGESNSKADRDAFNAKRLEVRRLMDELYLAALDVIRMGFHQDAAVYIITSLERRYVKNIYDAPTLEGAARMLDGGSNLTYVFKVAARSAVVVGDFDLARRLLEAIDEDQKEDIDRTLEFNLDDYKAAFEREAEFRKREAEEDRLPRVKLETTQGDIVVELFLDQAPTTVSNFIQLVEQGFYDGNDFTQVVDNLLALSGDPSGTGAGSSGKYIVDEHTLPDSRDAFRGSLVMAKLPIGESGTFVPNSASSQFAILFLPMMAVSQEQTVFGRVIEGMNVVSHLRRVDPNKKKEKTTLQLPPDRIIRATVIRRPEQLPTPRYFDPIHGHAH